jgi:hypothetical protein
VGVLVGFLMEIPGFISNFLDLQKVKNGDAWYFKNL